LNDDRTFPRANIPILVMSLVLALILWAVVTTQESAQNKEVVIGLEYSHIPAGFTVVRPPTEHTIHLNGPAEAVKGLQDYKETGTVDLRTAKAEGNHEFVIGLPYDMQSVAVPNFPKITLDVERLVDVTLPLQTGTSGRLPDPNIILGERDAKPHTIHVIGPRPSVAQVSQARVTIDLSKLHPEQPDTPDYDGYVELYDARGTQLNQKDLGLRVDPPNCQVRLAFMPAPVQKPVFVSVSFRGHPSAGYRVDGYDVTPQTVTLIGASLVLAGTKQVETEPVDLSGIAASHQFTVKVILPPNVSTSVPKIVKVRVSVRPVNQAPH
jgi:YbbR domain-containing protein